MEWLLIVVVMGKRLEQQNTVETLNGDRDALKKEGRFFVLSWDRRNYYYYFESCTKVQQTRTNKIYNIIKTGTTWMVQVDRTMQWVKHKINVVQLRVIMCSRRTKLNRQSQIWEETFHSIKHLPDREDLVSRTERIQILVEHALYSIYKRSQD